MNHNSKQVSKYPVKTTRMMLAYKKLDITEFTELRKTGEFRRPDVVPLLARPADRERELTSFCSKRAESIAAKIEKYLRECFLDRKDDTFSVDELLVALKETDVHPEARKILLEECLPKYPRIEVNLKGRLSYTPPYKITLLTDMVAMIKDMSSRLEGLFEGDIHDSTPLSESIIRKLRDSPHVFAIKRWDDKVTFFHSNVHPSSATSSLPPFSVETELVNIFKSIDVTRLDADIHIERYLERAGLNPLKSEKKPFPHRKKKAEVKVEVKKKPKPLVLRHNMHVEAGVMKRFDENGVQEEEGDDDEYLAPPEVKKRKSVKKTPPKKRENSVQAKNKEDGDNDVEQREPLEVKKKSAKKTPPQKRAGGVQGKVEGGGDGVEHPAPPEVKKTKKSPPKKRADGVQDEEKEDGDDDDDAEHLALPEVKKTSSKKRVNGVQGVEDGDESVEHPAPPEVKKTETPPKKRINGVQGKIDDGDDDIESLAQPEVKKNTPPKKRASSLSRKKSGVDIPENKEDNDNVDVENLALWKSLEIKKKTRSKNLRCPLSRKKPKVVIPQNEERNGSN